MNQASHQSTKPELIDSEIEELAKKIKETNTRKMVQIKNYPTFHNTQPVEMTATYQILSEDWTSVQGQFGWAELAKSLMIPYLTRKEQKYVSVRMADTKIFSVYRQYFSEEIRDCCKVDTIKVTKAECALLNEINFRHCDNFFGRLEFTTEDEIVALNDVKEMYEFLEFCLAKLVQKSTTPHRKCGFIRIASQNYVPYVWYEHKEYVPLFYFEGECKYLEDRSIEMRGWELVYMKLACKIQGIRKTFFDEDSLRVVEMDLVKKFFPPDTLFEWIWPLHFNVDSLIQKPLLRIVPVDKSVTTNQETANKKRIIVAKSQPFVQNATQINPALQRVPLPNEIQFSHQAVAGKNSTTYPNSAKPSSVSLPTTKSLPQPNICLNQYIPALTSIPTSFLNSSTTNRTPCQYQKYIPTLTSYPSALLNSAHRQKNMPTLPSSLPNSMTTKVVPMQYQKEVSTSGTPAAFHTPAAVYVNKPTYPSSTVASNVTAYKQTPMLRAVSVPNSNRSNVIQIPDFNCTLPNRCPYFMVGHQLADKMLNCINTEPYLTTNLLVTLEEVAASFFNANLTAVVNAVIVMRLDIFMPNKSQVRYLERCNRYPTVGLIRLKDFVNNLPQIKYILSA